MRVLPNIVNILKNASIRNCVSCMHDNKKGYSVVWNTNNDLNGYSSVGGVVSHTVWDGVYFGVSVSGSCYIESPDTLDINGSYYTQFKADYRVDSGNKIVSSLSGKVQFKTNREQYWSEEKSLYFDAYTDNAYHEHVVDMSMHAKWNGTITALRFYPFIDGVSGLKFHLRELGVDSSNRYYCDTGSSDDVCDKYFEYSHPCPWTGSPGYALASTVTGTLTIYEGVNDTLLVDIDDYGYHSVKIGSGVNRELSSIACDIEEKLNLIGVGGYAYARCYVDESRLIVESDWRNSSSRVVIGVPEEGSACVVLGFFGATGAPLYTSFYGTDKASGYEAPSVLVSPSSLSYLKSADRSSAESSFSITGNDYSVYGGNKDYKNFSRDTKIIFRNQTIIDYCNPIIRTGKLKFLGYSGDRYNNTELRIYREKVDGSISLVGSVSVPSSADELDRVFELDIDLDVKKGDLVSLYSAGLHLGAETEKGDFSYYLYDYDLGSLNEHVEYLSGAGEAGLPLYVRGSRVASEAVIDIIFDEVLPVESLVVSAEHEGVSEDINLCTLRAGGNNGGPYLTGYTGLDIEGNQAPTLVNIDSIIDGVKQDVNTVSTYCYPGWLDLGLPAQEDYYYTPFSVAIDFIKGIDVFFDVYKIKLYFVDKKNIKSFRIEVPFSFDANDENKIWGIGFPTYNEVYTELGLMDSEYIYLYNNPAILVANDYQVAYSHLDYRYLELVLEPYKTKAIRYNASLEGYFVEDPLQLDYSGFPIAPSPKIQEIEVYAKSIPENSISSYFSVETSKDGTIYLGHNDIDTVSSTRASYTVGRPTRYLRLNIKAKTPLKVFDIYGILSEGLVELNSNNSHCLSLNPPLDLPGSSVEKVTVTNDSSSVSDFYVDILEDRSSRELCVLWNKLDSDTSVQYSEIGPGGIVHRRQPFYLRAYNYAYRCPGYFLDKYFLRDTNSYLSQDGGLSWSNIGTIVTDGQNSTYITNEYELYHQYNTMYVAIPLGDRYNVSGVSFEAPVDAPVFDGSVLYSDLDTTNPGSIPFEVGVPHAWSVSYSVSARWVLVQVVGTYIGNPNAKYLSNVGVSLNLSSITNRGKLPWVSAGGYLTNGVSGYVGDEGEVAEGWISDGEAEYFCVDLQWFHNVSNVIVGPFGALISSVDDIDSVVAGEWPSIVDENGTGINVAYSSSPVNEPSKVTWGSFGGAPPMDTKWVLVKTATRVEEIIVHVNSNDQGTKKPFLNSSWCSCTTLVPYTDVVNTRSNGVSVGVVCPGGHGLMETFSLKQSFGIDAELSPRDSLVFWFYVSDVSELDFSVGYFRVGRSVTQDNSPIDINLTSDTNSYYEWPLSLLGSSLLDGWNVVNLPFSDNYRVGDLYFTRDDRARSGYTNKRDRIIYIDLVFSGVSDNDEFTILFDDFRIARRYYSSGEFGYGVYIPYQEHIKFPLGDFDPTKGTIEFYLKSDWNRTVLCNSCDSPVDHSLLRVFSSEDSSLFFLYASQDGLCFYVTDGSREFVLSDNSLNGFLSDTPVHIAIVWDFGSRYGNIASGIYVNNILNTYLNYSYLYTVGELPIFSQRSSYSLILGGRGTEMLVSSMGSSADSVFENIKVYNYPIFDHSYSMSNQGVLIPKRSHELVEVSLDGVNFMDYSDRGNGIPLVVENVSVGSSFDVFVRAKDISLTREKQFNRKSTLSISRS